MSEIGKLPRWNMEAFFPSLDSAEFNAAFEAIRAQLRDLEQFFDARNLRPCDACPAPVKAEQIALFEEVVGRLNALYEQYYLGGYVYAFVATDAGDDRAQGLASELRTLSVTGSQLETRFTGWVGSLDLEALLEGSDAARTHEYWVRRAQTLARHQMSEPEEHLTSELELPGCGAWARLHSDVSSLLTVSLRVREEVQTLPMSAVRALANDPDRTVREAAYRAELAAWERIAVPMAAALNGVKGFQQITRRRRGYPDDLDPTLFENGIDSQTLEAMHAACVASFPDFRRYLRAKAGMLGVERMAWFDVSAPVGETSRRFTWGEAERFIADQFGAYSPRMRDFAERSFRERWTDAAPRPGKQDGAFCMGMRPGESRILMNYDGSFNSVSTLAHELGHGYHNLNLAHRTPMQRMTPSTLAETASIFCETLVYDAAMREAGPEERVALLENSLQRSLMVVVDIHSRFLFEKAVFEGRARRELAWRELNDLMVDAQRQTYGDGLDPAHLHPYMWAVKGHYYGPRFYNYPYTFGLLFGLGLYAQYREAPDRFRAGYDELLSATGMADAATLAARFGIETREEAFWRSSLDVIRRDIDEFESLSRQHR
jgi:oligoendopeptidase F